jgi:A/G-specific adenine glycosylase
MLQQTTVAAVAARYDAFLDRFPDLRTLARARESSVLAAWSGLGYYARARNLRAAARRVQDDLGGRFPRDPATLRTLPGFGEYMAAAVASLAFGQRVPALDANVTRVVARLFAIEGVAGTRAHSVAVRGRVEELLPRRNPGDLTASLMDLGQQICAPRRPDCPACPLARLCAARAAGDPERFPVRPAKPRLRRVPLAVAYARRDGRVLLAPAKGELLRGLWLFPSAEGATAAAARSHLVRRVAKLGLRLTARAPVAWAHHTIVHRRLDIAVYPAVGAAAAPDGVRWLTPRALAAAPIPTLTRRIAIAAGFLPPRRPGLLD